MKPILLNYLRYNHWANEKICRYLVNVTDGQLHEDRDSEYEVIKKIVMHIADGEQTWLARLNGQNIPHMHNLDISGTFTNICGLILKNPELFINFVEEKKDSFFDESTEYINLKGKTFTQNNAEIILHCMNHSTFHRGQIISLLRHVGYTDQSASDFIMFLRQEQFA